MSNIPIQEYPDQITLYQSSLHNRGQWEPGSTVGSKETVPTALNFSLLYSTSVPLISVHFAVLNLSLLPWTSMNTMVHREPQWSNRRIALADRILVAWCARHIFLLVKNIFLFFFIIKLIWLDKLVLQFKFISIILSLRLAITHVDILSNKMRKNSKQQKYLK